MEQPPPEMENTDLIDVSDVEPDFDDLETDRRPRLKERVLQRFDSGEREDAIASLKDRFAALAVDLGSLYGLYWLSLIVYRSLAMESAAGPIPLAGIHGLVFHALFGLIALLWFVVPEFAFAASLGKGLCRLTVRHTDGSLPSLSSVLIRNLLRPVDLPFSALFLGAALMEWAPRRQRLGDLFGRTAVLRKRSSPPRQYALSTDIIASASARAVAFAIDAAIFAAFTLGTGLLLSPESPLASQLLLVLFPLAALLFFILPEWLTKSSPGKWILGFAICLEDGSAADLPSVIIRTLWRPVDCNPLGYLACLFSLRRQRPGDSAAGSVVIRAPREWPGIVGAAVILTATLGLLASGLQNRDSFLHEGFEINFLPSFSLSGGPQSRGAPSARLVTRQFHFAAGDPASPRKPAIFQPGETVLILFDVDGYRREEKRVWIQEDLIVRYPNDAVGLKIENVNDFQRDLEEEGPIRFENSVSVPESAEAGRYTIVVTVRDKLARQELKEQRFFYVNPPEEPQESGRAAAPPSSGTPPPTPPPPQEPRSNTTSEPPSPPPPEETFY